MNNFRKKFDRFPWVVSGMFEINLPSDPETVQPTASYLSELAVVLGRCEAGREPHIVVALSEALTNAIVHGNLEISSELRDTDREDEYFALIGERRQTNPYCDRRVTIETHILSDSMEWVITDDGGGFAVDAIPDPTDPENLTKSSGRGILMMNAFTDELHYNEKGNQVRLKVRAKRCGERKGGMKRE